RSDPLETATTTPWLRPSTASTKPSSSTDAAPGPQRPPSRSPLWTGSPGGTRSACTKHSTIARRPKSKRPTLTPRRPRPRPSNHGTEPRALQLAVGAAASLLTMQTGTDAAADGGPDVEGIVSFLLIGLVLAYAPLTLGNPVALWALGSRREAAVFRALGATTSVSWLGLMLELAMGV